MTILNPPWFMGGGVGHTAGAVRTSSYIAAAGISGVVGPMDLKLVAQSAPDGSVRVLPGAFSATSKYAPYEAYQGSVTIAENIPIAPNYSQTDIRYDAIYLEVQDPQKEGLIVNWSNFVACKIKVREGVAGNVKFITDVAPNSTGLLLGVVVMPPQTTTVTNAQLRDYREHCYARSATASLVKSDETPGWQEAMAQTTPTNWPSRFNFTIDVPYWAYKMKVRVDVSGIYSVPGAIAGQRYGHIKPWFDGTLATEHGYLFDCSPYQSTQSTFCEAVFDISDLQRGKSCWLKLYAYQNAASKGDFICSYHTQVGWRWEFLMRSEEY